MSFILDALRKSETERQRQSGPGLVDAGYRPPAPRRAIWLPLLVVVLVANLLLMGYFWLRREPSPPPTAAAPVAAPLPAPEPEPAGRSIAGAAGVSTPEDSDYAAMADLPAVEGEPVTEVLEPPPASGEPAPAARAEGDAVTAPSGHVTDDLPSAQTLMASGALPVQDLHLDIHVYSTVPAERFVFINMRKYGEGGQLPMGIRVEEITREGVILNHDGQRFVLTRD